MHVHLHEQVECYLCCVQGDTVVGSRDGSYSQADYYGDSIVNITLREPVKLKVYMCQSLCMFLCRS